MAAAEAAISHEPYRESAHFLLMHAHSAAGNRTEVVRAYEGLGAQNSATLVVGIGFAARITDSSGTANATVVKPGKPVTATAGEPRTIRCCGPLNICRTRSRSHGLLLTSAR